MLEKKNLWGLGAACIGIIICGTFTITVGYMYELDTIDKTKQEINLVTVEDYTASACLPSALYEEFLQKFGTDLTERETPIHRLKAKLTSAIKK